MESRHRVQAGIEHTDGAAYAKWRPGPLRATASDWLTAKPVLTGPGCRGSFASAGARAGALLAALGLVLIIMPSIPPSISRVLEGAPGHGAHIGRGSASTVSWSVTHLLLEAGGAACRAARRPHRAAARIRLARSPWQRRRLLPAPSALEQGVGDRVRPTRRCPARSRGRPVSPPRRPPFTSSKSADWLIPPCAWSTDS